MRELFSKMTTVAMIAGAALLVSACGESETTNTADNTAMTEMNAMAEGSMNDMTAVDSAAMEANMAMDTNAGAEADNAATNAM